MGIPAIISQVPAQTPYAQYIATNGQTVFPYPFVVTQDSDLVVVDNGNTLATNQGYTTQNVGQYTGGTITFTSGATAGDIITLYRDIPIERITQIGQNSGFSSTAFNAEYNNIYLIMQQLEEQFGQCLQTPISNTQSGAGNVLTPALYANKYLAFDANGNPEPAILTSDGTITPQMIGQIINPITGAETAASATPAFYIYSASPYVDPRRYGATGNGTTDDSTAMQTWLNVILAGRGRGVMPEDFYALCSPLSLTIAGADSLNISLSIEGASATGSRILSKPGATSPLLTFVAGSLQPSQIVLENFALTNYDLSNAAQAIGTGGHGLSLQNLAWIRASGLQVRGFDSGVDINTSLIILLDQQCQIVANNNGVKSYRTGTTAQTNNIITMDHCRISANGNSASGVTGAAAGFGVNFAGGSQLVMRGNDLESNGTSSNIFTGALITQDDLGGTFGLARVELYENWFEANFGTSVVINGLASAAPLYFAMEGGHIISSQAGAALTVGTADGNVTQALIKNVYSPGSGDTWAFYTNYLTLINTLVYTLDDANAGVRSYTNALTNANGVGGVGIAINPTMTLTGCTTSPTVTMKGTLSGNVVTITIPSISATSNTTACTLTGLPAAITPANNQPGVALVVDNGVQALTPMVVSSAGTIELSGLAGSGAFDNTGTKGTFGGTITFLLD